jgi:ABC-type dipeptide/oligopeptide/nickel transport system ATPase subunit
MEPRFLLKNVSKRYHAGSFLALDNVNLTIDEKKITVLMGKSGSGKSTLARILLGLENYDSGEIFYQGKPLFGFLSRAFRRKNQIMFQDPLLSVNPCFTVQKIMQEPLIINGPSPNNKNKNNKDEFKNKIDHFLDLLKIPAGYLNRYPSELSGGELQRIVLARALILEPEFVILDEPFSALDEIMAWRLMRDFKTIFTQFEVGVLFITHKLHHANYFGDYMAIIENGRLLQQIKKE